MQRRRVTINEQMALKPQAPYCSTCDKEVHCAPGVAACLCGSCMAVTMDKATAKARCYKCKAELEPGRRSGLCSACDHRRRDAEEQDTLRRLAEIEGG